MPQLPSAVDTDEHEDQGFDALPAGWYVAEVSDSELRQSSAGDDALNIEYTIIEGDHAGRKVWQWLNLWHSKEETRRIANGQFSTLCRACGHGGVVDDSDILHGGAVKIKLTVSRSEDYGASNNVKGWKSVDTPTPTGGASNGGSKPWKDKGNGSKPEPDPDPDAGDEQPDEPDEDSSDESGGGYVPPWKR